MISSLGASVKVVLAAGYSDSLWFQLGDSGGHRAIVCIDTRDGSPTQYRLFEGARRPTNAQAILLELGSPEEGIVVPIISNWLDSAPPSRLGLTEYGWDLMRDAVTRVGQPKV